MKRLFSFGGTFNSRLEMVLLLTASILCVLVLTSAVNKVPSSSNSMSEGMLAPFVFSAGLLCVSMGLTFLGFRSYQRSKNFRQLEIEELQRRLKSYAAIVKAEPQILIHWDENSGFQIMENSLFHVKGVPNNPREILRFGTWLENRSTLQLKTGIDCLLVEGKTFNLILTTQTGSHIEAEGRATGDQAILRIRDIAGYKRELSLILDHQKKISRDVLSSRALLNVLPSPAWLRDSSGKLTWVNQAYIKAVEAESDKEIIETQIELLESRQRRSIEMALKKTGIFEGKLELIVRNDKKIHQVITVTLGDESAGVAIDLAEIEKTRSTLDRQIMAYDRALERVSTAVAIFNSEAQLTFYNPVYQKLWQLEEQWLKTNPHDGTILDRLRDEGKLPDVHNYREWKSKILTTYKNGSALEDLWHLPNGRILHVLAERRPDGGVSYFYNDTTERLSLESRYIELTRVQGETLNTLKEGVAVFGTDGRLKLFNTALCQIWHMSTRELALNPHIEEFINLSRVLFDDRDTWENIKQVVTGFNQNREPLDGEMLRPDFSVIDFAIKPLPDGATLLIFADVTDSRKYQRTLHERNEALILSEKLKNQFIGHISYELRTPLTNIIGFSDILSSPEFGNLSDKQREYLDHISFSSRSLLSIINDLLDLATIDAGALELNIGPVNTQQIIDATLEGLHDRATKAGIIFDVSIENTAHTFSADEERVKQILHNLLSNAISFSHTNSVIKIFCWEDQEDIVFEIEDQGIGIPLDQQEKVFQRFESLSHGQHHRGTGLGLPLAKSLIEIHNGTIQLESKPGHGTKVTVRLPKYQKIEQQGYNKDQVYNYHETNLAN